MPIKRHEKIFFIALTLILLGVQVQSRVLNPAPKAEEEFKPVGEIFPDFQFTLFGETTSRSLSDFNREHALLVLSFNDCGCSLDDKAGKHGLVELIVSTSPASQFGEKERRGFLAPGIKIPPEWQIPKNDKESYYVVIAPGRRVVFRGDYDELFSAFPVIRKGRK